MPRSSGLIPVTNSGVSAELTGLPRTGGHARHEFLLVNVLDYNSYLGGARMHWPQIAS